MERPKIQQQFSDLKVSRGVGAVCGALDLPGAGAGELCWARPGDTAGFAPYRILWSGGPCFHVFSPRVCVQKPFPTPSRKVGQRRLL